MEKEELCMKSATYPTPTTNFVTIPIQVYSSLVEKAVRFDILTESLECRMRKGYDDFQIVDDTIVMTLTGMERRKLQREIEEEN